MHAHEHSVAALPAVLRAAGARVFVIVDTNILLSHLNYLERTLSDFAGAARQARWVGWGRCGADGLMCVGTGWSCMSAGAHGASAHRHWVDRPAASEGGWLACKLPAPAQCAALAVPWSTCRFSRDELPHCRLLTLPTSSHAVYLCCSCSQAGEAAVEVKLVVPYAVLRCAL